MTLSALVTALVALGVPAMVGLGAKAWYERKLLRAQAQNSDASATAVVTAAARELVDPLRKELAEVRAEARAEVEVERKKVRQVRDELQQALEEVQQARKEVQALRVELAHVRTELDACHAENARFRRRIAELEGAQS